MTKKQRLQKNKIMKKWHTIMISGEGYQNSTTDKFRKNTGHLDIKKFSPIGPFYSEIFDNFLFMGGGWGLEGVTPNASKLFLAKRFSVTGNGGGEGGGTPLNRKKSTK